MSKATRSARQLLAHVVLALLLVLVQHQASRHAFAHAGVPNHGQEPGAPVPVQSPCSDCDSFAAFGAALPTADAAPTLAPLGAQAPCCARAGPSPEVAAIAAYDSRAPPAVV